MPPMPGAVDSEVPPPFNPALVKQPGESAVLPSILNVSGIAATVNGETISNKAFLTEVMRDGGQPTLNEMIDRILLAQAAKKAKVSVTSAEVDTKLADMKKRVVEQLAERAPGETWAKWLTDQGRTEDYVRESVKARIIVEKLTALNLKPLTLEGQVHLYHILISTGSPYGNVKSTHTDDEAKALVSKIRDDVTSGKMTFQDAAKKFSEDPGSASAGGDLGWVSDKDMRLDPSFRTAAFNLKEHEISQPVKSQFGWHIILADTFGVHASAKDLKDLNDKEKDIRVQQGWSPYLAGLRKAAVVKNYIVPGAVPGQ